jgi:ribosomal protein S18 acetylase RimI-like enzyme
MPDAPAPVFRLMTAADVQVTAYVRKAALEALVRDQGREPTPWQPLLGGHFGHIIETDPGGSWIAEIGGLVVGYAQGFVRGDIWFLAQLFVTPEVHGGGIGRELLRLAMEYGRREDARVFSVVSSTSPVAQALYMRAGMFARGVGYRVSGPVTRLLSLPEPAAHRKRIVDWSGWLDRIDELDADVFGAARRQDHAHYMHRTDVDAYSFGLTAGGAFEGYGYVDDRGWIGPLAAREPDAQLPLLRMAAEHLAERGITEANMWVLSRNHVLMRALLGAGWKFDRWTFFLSNEPFGRFDRYQPSGGLML